jgi:hypothetical protein
MNTRTCHATLFALLLAGCGGAMNPGGGEDPDAAYLNDDAGDGAVDNRGVSPRATPDADAGEVCGDPDNPGRTLTRTCTSACGAGTQTCVDYRWTGCTARQPMTEMCGNRTDDDCNGQVDEGCGECMPGAMRPCYNGPLGTSGVGACRAGMQVCGDDRTWSPVCVGSVTPTAERCNGADDDCDGRVDEDFNVGASCSSGSGTCRRDGQYVCTADGGGTRCNALAAPPAPETCNGVDDDCDGAVDEGLTRACSNACGTGTEVCVSGRWTGCSARQPSAEVCDGRDNNCDGRTDEGLSQQWLFPSSCRYRVFVAFDGCNACRSTCWGYWVEPGSTLSAPGRLSYQQCFQVSAFARTPSGDVCLTYNGNSYEGEVHRRCWSGCTDSREDIVCR